MVPPGDLIKFLGIDITLNGKPHFDLAPLEDTLERIRKAPLKPAQKLATVRDYLIPSLEYRLGVPGIPRKLLESVDGAIRPEGEDLKIEADDPGAEPWQKPEHSPPHAKENSEDRNTEDQSEPHTTPQTLRTTENPEIQRRSRLSRTTTRRDCA
ncbi:Retrovirus-related Pol polyprotein from type-2 retrotransposable element R2DM [Trichinella spiralis]|uniref:Retrovirus-related Pol polyprotein from type-2 retrotransposable element R2DM n=1 Tax=Trichinella spiralis TaxID=6334 RepID=A0ABR3KQE8_TRISP